MKSTSKSPTTPSLTPVSFFIVFEKGNLFYRFSPVLTPCGPPKCFYGVKGTSQGSLGGEFSDLRTSGDKKDECPDV